MNLNEEIKKATDVVIAEKLPAMIEKKTTEMLDSILEETFRSYGNLAKAVKKQIEEKLNVNLKEFDLVDYTGLVCSAIKEELIHCTSRNTIEPIQKMVREAVGYMPKDQIKLSELIALCSEKAKEDSSKDEGQLSLHIEVDDKNNWIEVFIDPEENIKKEKCAVCFIARKNGSIFILKSNSHWDTQRALTPVKMAQMNQMEALILRFYAARTNIISDIENAQDSVYWSKFN